MNDREKLYELIDSVDIMNIPTENFRHSLADHLISNGVAVRDKGEWADVWSRDGNEYIGDGCDHCGFITTQKTKNFCPNCGAKMNGERMADND